MLHRLHDGTPVETVSIDSGDPKLLEGVETITWIGDMIQYGFMTPEAISPVFYFDIRYSHGNARLMIYPTYRVAASEYDRLIAAYVKAVESNPPLNNQGFIPITLGMLKPITKEKT